MLKQYDEGKSGDGSPEAVKPGTLTLPKLPAIDVQHRHSGLVGSHHVGNGGFVKFFSVLVGTGAQVGPKHL